jgi:AbiV family abortive infection protein
MLLCSCIEGKPGTANLAFILLKTVAKLKMSLRKLDALEFQCYQNAFRLHSDSLLLYAKDSFASAFALSVLSNEEFGKGFAIADISFHARLKETIVEDEEKFLQKLLRDHKLKQGWFVSHALDWPLMARKYQQKRLERQQADKNDAFYVGVRKGNHQIVRPFLLPKSKARRQLKITNDALQDLAEGTLSRKYIYEEVLDGVLRSRRLLKSLQAAAKLLS